MKRLAFLGLGFSLTLAAQTHPATLDEMISDQILRLEQAKEWAQLADFLEAQSPQIRGRYLLNWLQALTKAKRFERAIDICNAAIPQVRTSAPSFALSLQAIKATCLQRLGRHDEALALYLELNHQNQGFGFELCVSASALGAWGDLIEYGAQLARQNPGLGKAFQGEAYAKLGRYSEAERILSEAIQHLDAPPMAWVNLACCLVEREAYAEAVEMATQALQKEPDLMEALYHRGRAYVGLKRYEEGKTDMVAALATGRANAALAENIRENLQRIDRYLASLPPSKKASPPQKAR